MGQEKIIKIIFDYSVGITVRCSNGWNCLNEISFDSRFAMQLNAEQNMKNELPIFQYFIHPNQTSNLTPNVELFGKKRRIFCEECTEYELGNCIQCNERTEVEGINSTLKCQKCIDAELEEEMIEFRKMKIKKEHEMRRDLKQKRIEQRMHRIRIRRVRTWKNELSAYKLPASYFDACGENERLHKMQRKLNGYEKASDLSKFLRRK